MDVIKVARFGGPEVLLRTRMPEPVAGPGQVLVGVRFAPVLFLDTQIRAGAAREWFSVEPPYVPGAGIAGQVAAVGQGVDAAWAGRRVVADTPTDGGYRQRAVVPAEALVEVPEGLGLAEGAALLHDGRTALGLAEAVGLRAGEQVLVLGAGGGLGALLVQLAHAAGARVVAAAGSAAKRDLARDLGADDVADYTQPGWAGKVLALAGPAGPQVVFDGVGGQIGREAFAITAPGGRFSAHGTPGGGFAPIGEREAKQRQVTVYGIEAAQFPPGQARRLTGRALAEAAAGLLRPIIGQTFPLERAADAHRAIEARHVIGKTLLEVAA